jgi:hypothetical protein
MCPHTTMYVSYATIHVPSYVRVRILLYMLNTIYAVAIDAQLADYIWDTTICLPSYLCVRVRILLYMLSTICVVYYLCCGYRRSAGRLYMCAHVSSYYFICDAISTLSWATLCVLRLLYVCPHSAMCVLIVLHMWFTHAGISLERLTNLLWLVRRMNRCDWIPMHVAYEAWPMPHTRVWF